MDNIIELELAKKNPKALLEIKKIEAAEDMMSAKFLAIGGSVALVVVFTMIAYIENNCGG